MLAGCRSLTTIWEHATDLTAAELRSLGLEEGQPLPSESTIRRVLQDLDPAGLDAHLRSWLCTRTSTINAHRVIAADGKTIRGAHTGDNPAPHLLSALDHATSAVLTQQPVAQVRRVPRAQGAPRALGPGRGGDHRRRDAHPDRHRPVDPRSGWPLRADGQRQPEDPAPYSQGPSLQERPTHLLGRALPRSAGSTHRQGRLGPTWVDFPAAAQVVQVRHTRTLKGRKRVEVVYPGALPAHDRRPARDRRNLGPRTLGNREPTPRRSVTRSRARTATSCAPATAHRSWPPYATWPPGLIRLTYGTRAAIASTTRSLSRRPKRAISLLTRPTT